MPTLDQCDKLVGTLFDGRIDITALIGAGGMGTVYRGDHRDLGHPVALKLLHPQFLAISSALKCFEREATTAARIDHPHITKVYEFSRTEDGLPFLVMELVEGPTLRDVLSESGRLSLSRTLDFLAQLCDALSAAHRVDVIHRDLKPRNVAVPGDDHLKVLDFGLSKFCGLDPDAPPDEEGGLGTPAYMSPEQVVDGQVDHRTDIYNLGLMAYEMLVGTPPFSGPTMEVMRAHVFSDPRPPSSIRRGIPLGLDQLVLRCLAKSPQNRFDHVGEVARAVGFLRG
jgi:serine/threonine-protein kinase